MRSSRRGGFSLIELIVVTVLGALVISATLQVLITNQRLYTAQNAQIQGTQAIRAALEVLTNELREVSPAGGDLLGMDDDSLRVRAARGVGLICHDTASGVAVWRVLKIGDWFASSDSVFVFADNDGQLSTDDNWITTSIVSTDTTAGCGSNQAQKLTFASSTPFSSDSVSAGAEVRSFIHIAYGLMTYNSRYFLGRKISGGSWTPVVGPLTSRGVSFAYLDSEGATTSTAANVAQIQITVRTGSDVIDSTGRPVADSVTVRVFTRN